MDTVRVPVLAALVACALHAQGQTPVFRSRSDVVRTDVVVLDDRTGKPLAGLTARDFTVTEDGREQAISMFAADADLARATEASGHGRRVFLFVFGAGRLQGPVQPHRGVAAFLRQSLRSTDQAAVMAWNRVTDLTADHEALATVVERLQSVPEALLESWLRDQRSQGDVSEATQTHIDALFGGDGRLTLKAAPALLVGSEEFKRNSPLWSRWNRRFMMWDKLKVLAGIEHLRRADGEKRLVIISRNGFSLPIRFVNEGTDMRVESTEDDLRLATRAADANVILDIIHTYGTDTRTSSWFHSSQNLSHLTGGLFTSLRTADEQLARIDDASRGGYLIGYVPTNSVMDGKYRRVNISVARRGVTVVHRRGYIAHAAPPPVDPRSLMTRARFDEAAAAGIDVSDLKVTARAKAAGGSAERYVEVELSIDPSNLTLRERNGRWEGSLDLMVLCGDRNRSVIGKLDQQMTLSMEPAMYEQALKTGIPYRTRIPVKGVPAFAKVMVYDYDSDRLGTVSVRLN